MTGDPAAHRAPPRLSRSQALTGQPARDTPALDGETVAAGATGQAEPSEHVEDSEQARQPARLRWLVGPAMLVLLVILVRTFVVTPFAIPSESMENTLLIGDRIIVTRTTAPQDLRRGDLIVFDAADAFNLDVPDRSLARTLLDGVESLFGQGPATDYVKRVIGVPGDHVRCCAADGRIEVNGAAIDEPYLKPGERPSLTTFDITLPQDRFWVMGDNRSASADSRAHLGEPGSGMLPAEDVIGKVWVRYWPLDRLGTPDPGGS